VTKLSLERSVGLSVRRSVQCIVEKRRIGLDRMNYDNSAHFLFTISQENSPQIARTLLALKLQRRLQNKKKTLKLVFHKTFTSIICIFVTRHSQCPLLIFIFLCCHKKWIFATCYL